MDDAKPGVSGYGLVESVLVTIILPIANGLNASIWSAVTLTAVSKGYDLAVVGWFCAFGFFMRIPVSVLVQRFDVAVSIWTLVIYVACASAGFIYSDTFWGFTVTLVASISFVQTPIHHLIIRKMSQSDEMTRKMVSRSDASFTLGYCIATLAGGVLYDYGPYGNQEWQNVSAFILLLAIVQLICSSSLSPVRRSVLHACQPSGDTFENSDIVPAVELAESKRELPLTCPPSVAPCVCGTSTPNDDGEYARVRNDSKEKHTAPSVDVQNRRATVSLPRWLLHLIFIGTFANTSMYGVFWALYAIMLYEEHGWSATMSGASQCAGDGIGAALLLLFSVTSDNKTYGTLIDCILKSSPTLNMGVLLVLSALCGFLFTVPNMLIAVFGQIAIGTTYVLCQYSITSSIVQISDGNKTKFDGLIIRTWQYFTMGLVVANLLTLFLYEVYHHLPFYFFGSICFGAGAVLLSTSLIFKHRSSTDAAAANAQA